MSEKELGDLAQCVSCRREIRVALQRLYPQRLGQGERSKSEVLLLELAAFEKGTGFVFVPEKPPGPASAEFGTGNAKIRVIPDPRPRYCESSAPQSSACYGDDLYSSAKS